VTPLERLLAEGIPTRPPPASPLPRRVPPGYRWTPAEQDQHWADLCEAIRDWRWEDDTSLSAKRKHLRLARQADAA
jgi:hypothetical protein